MAIAKVNNQWQTANQSDTTNEASLNLGPIKCVHTIQSNLAIEVNKRSRCKLPTLFKLGGSIKEILRLRTTSRQPPAEVLALNLYHKAGPLTSAKWASKFGLAPNASRNAKVARVLESTNLRSTKQIRQRDLCCDSTELGPPKRNC